jgi:hypothetical protein
MMRLQVLDDARRLDHRTSIIEQQWEQPERGVALQLFEILGMSLLEQLVLERGLVRP